MSDDKVRLVEYLVEMEKSHVQSYPGKVIFIGKLPDTDPRDQQHFWMNRDKWISAGEPEQIYITVTSVFPLEGAAADEAVRVDVEEENADGKGVNLDG